MQDREATGGPPARGRDVALAGRPWPHEASVEARASWSSNAARLWSRARADRALRTALLGAGGLLAIVLASGIASYLTFGRVVYLQGALDTPGLIDWFGSTLKNTLAAPFAHWDSAWYVLIAKHGYGGQAGGSAAFFPSYPLLIVLVSSLGPGDVLAGVLISVCALVVGLRLTYMLTREEFGDASPQAPRLAVLATVLFPTAFYLTAVYPESLLLATSTGAFWFARKGRWASACLLAGIAAITHSLGLLLAVPIGLMYLRAHRWRLRPDVLWFLLIPVSYGGFMLYLAIHGLDPLSPLYSHEAWERFFTNPLSGTWEATRAAIAGVRQLIAGPNGHIYWRAAVNYGYTPIAGAAYNVGLFGCLALAVACMIAAFRRLPLAYGAYVAAVLLVVVSYPVTAQPLSGLARYVAVLFPVQMVMGRWLAVHARWRAPLLILSAVALICLTGYFATWHWVA